MVLNVSNASTLRSWDSINAGGFVESLAFAPAGDQLALAGDFGVTLYEISDDHEGIRLAGHDQQTHSVAFAPDGSQTYTGGVDAGGGRVRVWDTEDGVELYSFTAAPEGWGASVSISPDGAFAATSGGYLAQLWQFSGDEVSLIREMPGSVGLPRFSPDSQSLAYSTRAGSSAVIVWETLSGESLGAFTAELAPEVQFGTPSFSNDGSLIAAGTSDGHAYIWRVVAGTVLAELYGHSDWVGQVAFSPDDTLLATASFDTTASIWQVSNGRLLTKLEGHLDNVTSIAFAPSGAMLVTGSTDGTVILWGTSELGSAPGLGQESRVTYDNPGLGLRLQLPEGWKVQEESGAVIFGSSTEALTVSRADTWADLPEGAALLIVTRQSVAESDYPASGDPSYLAEYVEAVLQSWASNPDGTVITISTAEADGLLAYPAATGYLVTASSSGRTVRQTLTASVTRVDLTLIVWVVDETDLEARIPSIDAILFSLGLTAPQTPTAVVAATLPPPSTTPRPTTNAPVPPPATESKIPFPPPPEGCPPGWFYDPASELCHSANP